MTRDDLDRLRREEARAGGALDAALGRLRELTGEGTPEGAGEALRAMEEEADGVEAKARRLEERWFRLYGGML